MTAGTTLLRREAWSEIAPDRRQAWFAALRAPAPDAEVGEIVAAVRERGDAALRELTRRFDGADLASVWVDPSALDEAQARIPADLRAALAESVRAVTRYHADQRDLLRAERRVRTGPGVTAWRRWAPIRRAGGYVPGGRAAYASSVIMLGVPARLAGVEELIVATPPNADGEVAPAILAAARIVGVARVLRVGGAQAIAALAYGTESVPRVDRILGAGNAWVTAAKRALSGEVAIDLPAGPSECVVLADATAEPELVAWDLLAQAEHGPDSLAICVTDDARLLDAVEAALPSLATTIATGNRALATLAAWGRGIVVDSMEEGISVVDGIAAEHVSVQCRDPEAVAARIGAAGAIFIGPWSAVAAGDYATGTNHVLPTGGAARAFGGVGVESFGRWIEVQSATPAGAARVAATVRVIAAAEGLPGHAASVAARAERAAGAPSVDDDPVELLRRPGEVVAYPAEASDEELAERFGLPLDDILRLDMNTLGGGPLPAVRGAMAAADPARVVEYGDLTYRRLRAALGASVGVAPERVVPGAGADELIRLVTTLAVGPGDAVVIPTPTFSMFAVEASLTGARAVELPRLAPGEPQPAAAIRELAESASARLVWLCSPNNPTGDLVPLDEIASLADGLPALVAVDEVYLDFAAAPSAIELQAAHPNVLVLRSLSKAFGLAGARLGYLVVPPALADRFDAVRLPLSVASSSEALALAVLADPDAAAARRAEIVAERRRLEAALVGRGFASLPTVANFVTVRPPDGGPDAAAIEAALQRRGIFVRAYGSGPIAGWLRITARTAGETDRLLAALAEIA